MLYQWSNPCRLKTLKVWGEDNRLYFETANEQAAVHLKNGDIESVHWKTRDQEGVVNASQAKHIVVGQGNTKRDVYHYIQPSGPLETMRLGITKHAGNGGTWSSLPHDFELHPTPDFEEAFFHILKGGTGRAVQLGRGMWVDGQSVDEAWPVKDQTFSTIPMGYHPCVGEPEVQVSYVWIYLAKKKSWEKI